MYNRRYFFLAFLSLFVWAGAAEAAEYTVQNTFFYENYTELDFINRGTALTLTYREQKKYTLFGKVSYQRKYDFFESLQEVGIAYKFNEQFTLQGSAGASIGTATFPKGYTEIEGAVRLRERIYGHAGYRFSSFENGFVHVFPVGVTWTPLSLLSWHGRFFYVVTDFENAAAVSNNSFLMKVSFFGFPRQEIQALYARNSESFLSIDRVGKFSADTYGLFWKGMLHKSWQVLAALYYQKRFTPLKQAQRTFEIGWSYTW